MSLSWVQKVQYRYSAALAFPATEMKNISVATRAKLTFRINGRGAIDMVQLLLFARGYRGDKVDPTELLFI